MACALAFVHAYAFHMLSRLLRNSRSTELLIDTVGTIQALQFRLEWLKRWMRALVVTLPRA